MMSVRQRTNYPLTVSIDDLGTGFTMTVDTVTPACPAQVGTMMMTAITELADALQDEPASPLDAVQVLTEAERRQILTGLERHGSAGAPAFRWRRCSRRRPPVPRMRWRWCTRSRR